ncbi:GMC family oxidoreductase [Mesorhizobium huakuii]|uniref:GMC family oxidoreductase n=1 Tax=Mesorhizobium huakuii TaxID=28104 RepID=A0A7G6T227_9HYPH|nr:GMC family oxidoreductase [Mesorhizobium huakuii]QND60809.1 GMC family oxidoreductase [Mesorhizobium huakuii]
MAMDLQQALEDARKPDSTPFDYIVIGSGAGGGPLAARLALSGRRVLVIEAGLDTAPAGSTKPQEVYAVPAYNGAATEDAATSWDFSVRHYENDAVQARDAKYNKAKDPSANGGSGKGGIFYPRAAALGGCTAHHAMIIIRPNDSDWDEIASYTGDDSWRSETMQGYFPKIEQCLYYNVYKGFLGRILGWLLWLIQVFATLINPRRQLDPNGHGSKGWQPTSFIDPIVIAGIARGDRTLLKLLFNVIWSALAGKDERSAFKRALAHLQIIQFLDPNVRADDIKTRARPTLLSIGTNGEQRYGLREWLLKVAQLHQDRLVLMTGTHAMRLIFDKPGKNRNGKASAPRAIGVEVARGQYLYKASKRHDPASGATIERYFAKREIIVSGGSFNSPQLLMLSGIGDVGKLKKLGIAGPRDSAGKPVAPVVNLPGVGLNLQDRYEVSIVSEMKQDFSTLKGASFKPGDPTDPLWVQWDKDKTGLYGTNGGALAMMMSSKVNTKPDNPDFFVFGAPAAFRGYYWNWSNELLRATKGAATEQRNLWTWVILKAYTNNNLGTVNLLSADPFDVPEINFNSFPKAGGNADLIALCEIVQRMREINGKITGMKAEIQPGTAIANNPKKLEQWVQDEAWGHHACGTCRMGADPWRENVVALRDKNAVLDSRFQVHGVAGLRVVDASVFKKIPGYFIVTPVFMIAEKAADTILADYPAYPSEIEQLEAAAIYTRREIAGEKTAVGLVQTKLPQDCIGLALSGGGIRSATYGLGVLQALAATPMLPILRKVDFLATVSGGGYIGGFLGRLYTRIPDDVPKKAERVEAVLGDTNAPEIWWLRRHADYLVSAGRSDLETNVAVIARNLAAELFCVAALVLGLLGALRWISDHFSIFAATGWAIHGIAVSPYWLVSAAVLALAVLPAAGGYWLTSNMPTKQPYPVFALLLWATLLCCAIASIGVTGTGNWGLIAIGVLLLAWLWQDAVRWLDQPGDLHDDAEEREAEALRQAAAAKAAASQAATAQAAVAPTAAAQTAAAQAAAAQAAAALVATAQAAIAQAAADLRKEETRQRGLAALYRNRLARVLGSSLLLFAASLVFVILDTLAHYIGKSSGAPSMGVLLVIAPLVPFLRKIVIALAPSKVEQAAERLGVAPSRLFIPLLAFSLAGLLFLALDVVAHASFEDRYGGPVFGVWLTAAALLTSVALGRAINFVNLSSLQQQLAQKLTRAFLGASNDARVHPQGTASPVPVQVSDDNDDTPLSGYHPEAKGGPLHLISVCVNQTVDHISGRQLRQNKSLPMCLGPGGISVGRQYHAIWETETAGLPDNKINVRALPVAPDPHKFHVLATSDGDTATVEQLSLGHWMGISAASLSTGAGRTGSLPMSLLFGLFNVRLGYWWNSGINAGKRPGRYPPNLWRRIKGLPAAIFAVQTILFNEWRGYFEGPSARRWYLSDGGHFDNTSLYELIRRRLPFIIAVDGGQDQNYQLDDLAVLMRQVRLDFGAELNWLDPSPAAPGASAWVGLDARPPP